METMPKYSGPRCNSVDPFFVGETICTAWFTLEFLIRLASCPSKRSFFYDFKNVVDFIAVMPYYASLVLESGPDSGHETGRVVAACDSLQTGAATPLETQSATPIETSSSLTYLRTIRLVRVVRILKLTKYCLGLQVTQYLLYTMGFT